MFRKVVFHAFIYNISDVNNHSKLFFQSFCDERGWVVHFGVRVPSLPGAAPGRPSAAELGPPAVGAEPQTLRTPPGGRINLRRPQHAQRMETLLTGTQHTSIGQVHERITSYECITYDVYCAIRWHTCAAGQPAAPV